MWRSNPSKASHQGTQEMNRLELNVLMKLLHIALNLPKCPSGVKVHLAVVTASVGIYRTLKSNSKRKGETNDG